MQREARKARRRKSEGRAERKSQTLRGKPFATRSRKARRRKRETVATREKPGGKGEGSMYEPCSEPGEKEGRIEEPQKRRPSPREKGKDNTRREKSSARRERERLNLI